MRPLRRYRPADVGGPGTMQEVLPAWQDGTEYVSYVDVANMIRQVLDEAMPSWEVSAVGHEMLKRLGEKS